MHHKARIIIAGLAAATVLSGQAQSMIGKTGDWTNTIATTVFKGDLYSVEQSGALYVTTLANGTWKQIGKPDFANTSFLLALTDKLVSIEKDGSLYLIDPADGSWRQSGKTGDWAGTIAATLLDNRLYTVEQSGTLYVTDLANGTWKQIGKPDFANTLLLFALPDKLVSIEKDGSLCIIDPANGARRPSGATGALKNIAAGAIAGNALYTVTSGGALCKSEPGTGASQTIGTAVYSGTKFLLSAGQKLYTIAENGNLSAVSLVETDSQKPAKAPAQTSQAKAPAKTSQEETNPALTGQMTFKFMGKWKGDPTGFEKDPEFLRQKEANPQMVQALVDMMKNMVMKVTLDGITMTVMDQTVGPFPFEAISASGNSLLIENMDGPKKGIQSRIVFLSDKQIQIIEGADEGKAMFFRKD